MTHYLASWTWSIKGRTSYVNLRKMIFLCSTGLCWSQLILICSDVWMSLLPKVPLPGWQPYHSPDMDLHCIKGRLEMLFVWDTNEYQLSFLPIVSVVQPFQWNMPSVVRMVALLHLGIMRFATSWQIYWLRHVMMFWLSQHCNQYWGDLPASFCKSGGLCSVGCGYEWFLECPTTWLPGYKVV